MRLELDKDDAPKVEARWNQLLDQWKRKITWQETFYPGVLGCKSETVEEPYNFLATSASLVGDASQVGDLNLL
jgi:hypothetical protein